MLLTDELLLNYKRCQRRTFLDVYGNRELRDPEREFVTKLRRENQTHIQKVLTQLNLTYHQPLASYRDWFDKAQETKVLMEQGVECIYNGTLIVNLEDWQSSPKERLYSLNSVYLIGNPHILLKQTGQSKFGNWLYSPLSIRLGRRPKPEYKLIAAFHAQLLCILQETSPTNAKLILREFDRYEVNLSLWTPKMQQLVVSCLQAIEVAEEPELFISRQRCNLCHWHSHCYSEAKSQQHLSLVPGVTPSRYESLREIGVESLKSLATFSPLKIGTEIDLDLAFTLKQQAVSILQNQAILRSNQNLLEDLLILNTNSIELYFDIEAEPDRNLDYLLGVLLVDRKNNTENFYAFLAEKPEDEGKIWQQFLDLVNAYEDAPIFHFSEYEVETIQRLAKLYQTPFKQIDRLLIRSIDLHRLVVDSVTLPVESYSLKSLANWLGFEWRDRGVSGEQSVCWYDRWLNTGDRHLLDAILRYNEDDCRATFHLKDWLVEFMSSYSSV